MLADVDALVRVRLEKISVEKFEDLKKNVVRQDHCVFQLSKLEAIHGRTFKHASIRYSTELQQAQAMVLAELEIVTCVSRIVNTDEL